MATTLTTGQIGKLTIALAHSGHQIHRQDNGTIKARHQDGTIYRFHEVAPDRWVAHVRRPWGADYRLKGEDMIAEAME